MHKVFIDGKEGTTGLKLAERLKRRDDIEILEIPEEFRKDTAARKDYLNNCDIAFLCLPDEAAKEAVALVENPRVKIIDASTAHRTKETWAYGFPELGYEFRKKIEEGYRIAVPGCHASGFLSIVCPLVALGVLSTDYPVVCHSVTGYTGGGKKMIAEYEGENRSLALDSPRQYALGQSHKHLNEMTVISGLEYQPVFNPIVASFPQGMAVTVPLYTRLLNNVKTNEDVFSALKSHYDGQKLVTVERFDGKFLAANMLAGKNSMKIIVGGNDERINITAVFDNLGKGASGAAVQCMNIATGTEETKGLTEE
ncbi:MAG TPA: N-acetyl-gamma-glutamyl-phosphate reductase [Clostridia bacterium]|jgi:N-acetyl-gamma-glutamyl-phosphate reductase|nr:N-acetyl-gamma-glutamyl-phosphate reductase [Clostridia bacterium]